MRLVKCYRCKQEKPAEDFAWRRKHLGQRDSFCRPCRAAYKQEHYAKNKERYIAQAAQRKRQLLVERVEFLIEYFRAHPCTDCGETDPVVLEFDHVGEKSFTIGTSLHYRPWKAILEEIEKCEVVCSNCHRRRTARRRGALRLLLSES